MRISTQARHKRASPLQAPAWPWPHHPKLFRIHCEILDGRDDCRLARGVIEGDHLEVRVHLGNLAEPLHARAARVERVEQCLPFTGCCLVRPGLLAVLPVLSPGDRDGEHGDRADVLSPERLVVGKRIANGIALGTQRACRHRHLEVHASVDNGRSVGLRLACEQHRKHRLARLAQPEG
eukprot:scaffold6151_cov129-Isochrysis_galbana.AAC.3